MKLMRRHFATGSWAALVAAFALALLPTVSHALAAARGSGGPWTEVCTPQGPQRVAVASGQPDVPALVHAVLEHCPLCTLAAGDGAAPLPPGFVGLATVSADAPQPVGATVPRSPGSWTLARPRAPPRSH